MEGVSAGADVNRGKVQVTHGQRPVTTSGLLLELGELPWREKLDE